MAELLFIAGLVLLTRLDHGEALASQCYSCDVTGTDQTCNSNAVIQTCQGGDYGGCQTAVRSVKDQTTGDIVTSIIKSCKSITVCRAEVQTYSSTCTGPTNEGSICYYCCETDLCNDESVLTNLFPRTSTVPGPSQTESLPTHQMTDETTRKEMVPTTSSDKKSPSGSDKAETMSPEKTTKAPSEPTEVPSTPDESVPTWVVILVVILAVLVTVTCCLCLCCIIRRRKRKSDGMEDKKAPTVAGETGPVKKLDQEGDVYNEIEVDQIDTLPMRKPSEYDQKAANDFGKLAHKTGNMPKQSLVIETPNDVYEQPIQTRDVNGNSNNNNSTESYYERLETIRETSDYLTIVN